MDIINTTFYLNASHFPEDVNVPVSQHRSLVTNIIIALTISIIGICAVIGNGMIILLVSLDRELRSQASNILVIHLAAVDIVTALIVMSTSSIAVMADHWPFSNSACTAQLFFNFISMSLTIALITTLTLDRLISIWKPLRYHSIVTASRLVAALAVIYVVTGFFTIYPLVNGLVVYDYWEAACSLYWIGTVGSTRDMFFAGFVVMFFIPSLLILCSNIYIICVAHNLRFNHRSTSQMGLSTIPSSQRTNLPYILPTTSDMRTATAQIGNQEANHFELAKRDTNQIASCRSEETEVLQVVMKQPALLPGSTAPHRETILGRKTTITTAVERVVYPIIATEDPSSSSNDRSSSSKRSNYSLGSKNNLVKPASINLNVRDRASLASRRIFYSIFAVTSLFFVCLMPYSVVKNAKLLIKDSHLVIPNEMSLFGTLLQFINSMVNPLIYGILRQDFRRAYHRLRRRRPFLGS